MTNVKLNFKFVFYVVNFLFAGGGVIDRVPFSSPPPPKKNYVKLVNINDNPPIVSFDPRC